MTTNPLTINQYVALPTQHVAKENTVLFPIGDDRLSENKKTELWEGFETMKNKKSGLENMKSSTKC